MTENLNDKKIALLLSGGVDSSVVLHELCRQGLHPDCFYIKIGPEEDEEWDCSSEEDLEQYDVVGPVCESSDVFGTQVMLNKCHRGDLVAIRSAGAYGESMASQYNCRPLAPAVFSTE